MHSQVHLTIVTSLSMIITFVLHCIMEYTPVRHSYLQVYSIDGFRNFGLNIRCFYNYGIKDITTCTYFFTEHDKFYYVIHCFFIPIVLMLMCFFPKITLHIYSIFFTLLVGEFLAQYFTFLGLSWTIDILTIYMFVWQLITLVLKWICLHLLPPILIIEQGSFCVITALMAWIWHFILARYIPLPLNLFWFWIFSVIDIWACLHHRGFLYDPPLTDQASVLNEKCDTGTYYIKGIDKWKTSASLGLGDFCTYNILVLFALPPSSSMIIKICVTLGSIVSVQIGRFLAFWLRLLTKTFSGPGVPLPVITVSMYLFILDIIIPRNFNQCMEL